MPQKSTLWKDYGLWMLLAFNVYTIYYCYIHPNEIHTVYVIFWMQSVSIGFFNVLGILTFNKKPMSAFVINETPKDSRGCTALFFTFHYGMFHLVYLVFITIKLVDIKQLDYTFIKLTFWIIIATGIIQYLHDKSRSKEQPVNVSTMFALPYARIIPMHLAILAPSFFSISPTVLFLVLKFLADIVMYIVYTKFVFSNKTNS